MKKLLALLSLLFIFGQSAFSQTRLCELEMYSKTFKIEKPNKIDQAINPSTNEYCVFLRGSFSLDALLFNADGTFRKKISMKPAFAYNNHLEGAFYDGVNYNAILKTNKKVTRIKFDFNAMEYKTEAWESNSKKRQHLSSFTHNNVFYQLYVNKTTSEFSLESTDQEKSFKTSHFSFLEHDFLANGKITPFYNAARRKGLNSFKCFENNLCLNPEDAIGSGKIYLIENEMKMVMDINNEVTTILTVDMNNMKTKIQEFAKNIPSSKKRWADSNSYYLNGKLLQLYTFQRNLHVQIIDTKLDSIINTYELSASDTAISWANIPATQSKIFSKEKKKTIKTVSSTIKRINSAEIFIFATPDRTSNNILVSIGGILYPQYNNNFGTMGTMGGMPGFGPNAESYYSNESLPVSNNFKGSIYYFQSLMDTNYQHVDKDITNVNTVKVMDYLSDMRKEKCSYFQRQNNFNTIHYLRKEKKLKIIQF